MKTPVQTPARVFLLLTPLVASANVLTGTYGTSDRAYVEVLFGDGQARGVLPFDLPASMETVEASVTDRPFDTKNPLFKAGTLTGKN